MPEGLSEIYFHEDDYCQQELLPLAAMEFCRQQINEIDEFASSHQAPGGVGWTDMFIRNDSPQMLTDLVITPRALRDSLREHLPEIPVVYSGYSSHREICGNTFGFGLHAGCVVYADWNDTSVIEHIWTSLFTTQVDELNIAVTALQELGRQFPLLYVDWAWSFATPLDQSASLYDRLNAKNTEIERR